MDKTKPVYGKLKNTKNTGSKIKKYYGLLFMDFSVTNYLLIKRIFRSGVCDSFIQKAVILVARKIFINKAVEMRNKKSAY